MSNDVISDISLFHSHTSNMIKYIDNIIKVIDDVRTEGYEMYSVVMEKKAECQQKTNETNYRIQEVNRFAPQDSDTQLYDLNILIKQYENRYNDLDNSQKQLDNIAQECTQMRKTVEVLNENVQRTNKVFNDTMKYYEEAK